MGGGSPAPHQFSLQHLHLSGKKKKAQQNLPPDPRPYCHSHTPSHSQPYTLLSTVLSTTPFSNRALRMFFFLHSPRHPIPRPFCFHQTSLDSNTEPGQGMILTDDPAFSQADGQGTARVPAVLAKGDLRWESEVIGVLLKSYV